jgi:hypothetical protein
MLSLYGRAPSVTDFPVRADSYIAVTIFYRMRLLFSSSDCQVRTIHACSALWLYGNLNFILGVSGFCLHYAPKYVTNRTMGLTFTTIKGGDEMFKKYLFSITMVLLSCVFAARALSAPQPIVYYTFDELGDVVADASGNGNDGTPMGDVKLKDDGKVGKSFEFNGTNAYVELARVVQDDFTLMAWIKADQPGIQAGNQGYQGSGLIWSDVSGVANDFILAVLGTKLSLFRGNPDLSVNSDTDVVTGEWVHVVGVRSATDGKISIYIDGKHEKTIDHGNAGPLNALPTIAIGGNVLDSRYYTGLVDEVRLFDVALSEQEVQQVLSPTSVDALLKISTTWGTLKAVY